MIVGIVGDMGSGKTLLMTYFLYDDFLKGRTIYSNYHLKFNHNLIYLKDLISKIKNKEQFSNLTMGIDEIGVLFESRRSGTNVNLIGGYISVQSRKKTMDILYTSQFLYQVEKRIRDNTLYLIKCTKIDTDLFEYKLCKRIDSDNITEGGDFQTLKTFILKPHYVRQLYELYDTEELIMDMGINEVA